jgi:hypothetical protein
VQKKDYVEMSWGLEKQGKEQLGQITKMGKNKETNSDTCAN